MNKMKSKSISIGLIPILILASICFIIPPVIGAKLPIGATYSWGEITYRANQFNAWEDAIVEYNYSGSDQYGYDYTYFWDNYSYDIYGNPLTYVECISTNYRESNFTSYNRLTMTGNYTNIMDIDAYQVEASYGNSLQFNWMAGKKFTWQIEVWILDQSTMYNYTDEYYYSDTHTYIEKYYENNSIVPEGYYYIDNYEGWDEYSWNSTYSNDYIIYQAIDYTFTMPMILTSQIFKSTDGDNIAWMDMFYNYLVFNDTDGNGILSAGLSDPSGGSVGAPSIYTFSEFQGMMMPLGLSGQIEIEAFYKNNFSAISPGEIGYYTPSQSLSFPNDKSVDEIAEGIVFTPPTQVDDTISWDIMYSDYPINGFVYGEDYNIIYSSSYYDLETSTIGFLDHEQASPGNYKFGFDYNIGSTNSTLDYTVDLPRITNDSFYQGLRQGGYSLSMPHYTYLMASSDIDQTTNTLLTKPADIFSFEIDGVPIGDIDMINPLKKNYTLYEYPIPDINSVYESQGGTVAKIITSAAEQNFGPFYSQSSGLDVFSSILFSLEEQVSDNPAFNDFYSYYGMETQNYPVWSGCRLVHDPTFIAYYATPSFSNEDAINGYAFIPLIGVASISILIILKRMKLKNR